MKVAVVTGASKGLGREIAIELGESGYSVAVNYCRSHNEAREVALRASPSSMAMGADVGNQREVEEMAHSAYERWGRIDVVVNNAGVTRDGLIMRYGEDDWDEVIRVNLKGCFNMAKSFAPLMARSGGGHIVNISSNSGLGGKAGQAAYSASKAALVGFTRTMARELAGENIRVNAVLPGYMATDMGAHAPGAMRRAKQESVINALSDPREVARFIVYLVSTKGITGQVFRIDSRI